MDLPLAEVDQVGVEEDAHRHQDDQQPEVGEQGEDHGHTEHRVGLNLTRLTIRNDKYTESVKNMF